MKALKLLLLSVVVAACSPDRPTEPESPQLPVGEITELTVIDTKIGDGAVAESGPVAVVHYTGWLYEPGAADRRGTKFDSSVDRGQAFQFPLGAGRVIRGWDEGVVGMRVGGKRLLLIPPEFGYGERGAANGAIPPNATLLFEVDLLELR
jgi:FKBP-type peptidyl-prolyl cis-trans isomerase